MEVRHEHNLAHKKKISEYFLDFFMLFFAVTLGFFAENYREYSSIDHSMQENYQAIEVDLKQDNEKIDSIFKEGKNRINLVSLSYLLYEHKKGKISELLRPILIGEKQKTKREIQYTSQEIGAETWINPIARYFNGKRCIR
jgi:hypothetical protein